MSTEDNQAANTNAVAIKLPTFWPANPEVWFLQVEAQFATRGIVADDTKFHHVVAALHQDSAGRLLDLLRSPPTSNKYRAVKDRLITTFTLSDYDKAGLLLNHPGLGSDSPSALMDKMLAMLGDHAPCFLFRRIFINLMPEDIRPVLVHTEVTDPRELAKLADRLCQARPTHVSAISRDQRSKASVPITRSYCYYHARFGNKAKNCKAPCTFPHPIKRQGPSVSGVDVDDSLQGNATASRQ